MVVEERKPKIIDYLAGAILTNGLATLAIYLIEFEPFFVYLLIPLWCLSAGFASYLVCIRTTKEHLLTGAKTAVISIVLGVIMEPIFEGLDLGKILLILGCFFIGGIGGAYYALRRQLRIEKLPITPPPTTQP